MRSLLYFLADAFFEVAPEYDGGEDEVKDQVKHPRNGVAKHDRGEGGGERIDDLHPKNAEAEIEGYIGYAGQHRIAKSAHRCRQHVADGVDEHK